MRGTKLPRDSAGLWELARKQHGVVTRAQLREHGFGSRAVGFRVDFYWRHLGLVVETDGLRYHRTPAQQARDQRRDQVHAASGLTTMRFAEAQIRYEPEQVRATLVAVAARLSQSTAG